MTTRPKLAGSGLGARRCRRRALVKQGGLAMVVTRYATAFKLCPYRKVAALDTVPVRYSVVVVCPALGQFRTVVRALHL